MDEIRKSFITGKEFSNEENETSEISAKKMCLNCIYCHELKCMNEQNMTDVKNKLMASPPSGYEILNIELAPIKLNDATKRCKKWELNNDLIINWAMSLFS